MTKGTPRFSEVKTGQWLKRKSYLRGFEGVALEACVWLFVTPVLGIPIETLLRITSWQPSVIREQKVTFYLKILFHWLKASGETYWPSHQNCALKLDHHNTQNQLGPSFVITNYTYIPYQPFMLDCEFPYILVQHIVQHTLCATLVNMLVLTIYGTMVTRAHKQYLSFWNCLSCSNGSNR